MYPDSTKMMDVIALDDCDKKCRWLTAEQWTWWADFLPHGDIMGPNGVLPLKSTILMQEKANGTWKN